MSSETVTRRVLVRGQEKTVTLRIKGEDDKAEAKRRAREAARNPQPQAPAPAPPRKEPAAK